MTRPAYDFTRPVDRSTSHSLKWSGPPGELPMWLADMDFPAAPEIVDAIRARADSGLFGYTQLDEEYAHALSAWWARRHGFAVAADWVVYCAGVLPAVSSLLRRMTAPGDQVVVLPPVYHVFFELITGNGRRVLPSDLRYDGTGYRIDFADLERKLAASRTRVLLFCNPHNPTGNLWDAPVLERIGELCARHDVLVVSDEIHGDLTTPGHAYTPFASVSPLCARTSVTCVSPTKTFNLAGLQTGALLVPDPALRAAVARGLHADWIGYPNVFAADATLAAYAHGERWLDGLRAVVTANRRRATRFLADEVPELRVVASDATYLMWIDCAALTADTEHLCAFLRDRTGLHLSAGAEFRGNGSRFVRVNVACQPVRLEDALGRLRAGVRAYRSEHSPGRRA
ncbi:MalY/PatB family protein [Streptomyces sp. NPDC017673]|uniref:MalY/PatB family protein n=1 Tax=unclassified Streptomyces TaxID=2593676 RepID=UPI0037AA1B27